MSNENISWEKQPFNPLGGGNLLLRIPHDDSWVISYQPSDNPTPFDSFFSKQTKGESAICDYRNNSHKYYILNGDWREEYEKLASQGLEACINFFNSHPEIQSSWSNQPVKEQNEQ